MTSQGPKKIQNGAVVKEEPYLSSVDHEIQLLSSKYDPRQDPTSVDFKRKHKIFWAFISNSSWWFREKLITLWKKKYMVMEYRPKSKFCFQ